MDQHVIWSLAETGYILGGVAALGGSWSIWRLAPRGRETSLLCGSVLALGAYYGCLAVDASLHAMDSPASAWSALGHTAMFGSGALFNALLLAIVTRLLMPARPTLWRFQFLVAQIVVASGLALGWSGSL